MPIPTILSFGPSIRAQCLRFPLPLQVQKPETGDLSQSEQHNSCSSPSHPIPSDPIRYDPKRVELRHVHLISWRVYSTVQYSFFCLSQFAVYFIIITIIFLWLTLGTICPVTASFMVWVSRSFILLSTLRLRNLLSNCRCILGLSKHSQHLEVGIRTCIDLDLKPGRFMDQPSMRMP